MKLQGFNIYVLIYKGCWIDLQGFNINILIYRGCWIGVFKCRKNVIANKIVGFGSLNVFFSYLELTIK